MAEQKGQVTVTFTAAQVSALHSALLLIENDPDWVGMLGGQREADTLYRAHNAIMLAKQKNR